MTDYKNRFENTTKHNNSGSSIMQKSLSIM